MPIFNFQGCKQFQSIRESFSILPKLQNLSLRGCSRLIQVPKSFLKLVNLESLNVKRCPLLQMDTLPMDIFRVPETHDAELSNAPQAHIKGWQEYRSIRETELKSVHSTQHASLLNPLHRNHDFDRHFLSRSVHWFE